ncbi:MAG: hypothetical protein ACI9S8_000721 [Chlamydiales bacterium]|jgi:hypothetical protein
MHAYYKDYYWKQGRPYGSCAITGGVEKGCSQAFRIVSDPYHRRITVEAYEEGLFSTVLYDSAMLDFRELQARKQIAWKKEVVSEDAERSVALIRNEDDRVVLKEIYTFDGQRCMECLAYSPQDLLISRQKMLYTRFGDSTDGVILYDAGGRPVMSKTYDLDDEGEFKDLLGENWEI